MKKSGLRMLLLMVFLCLVAQVSAQKQLLKINITSVVFRNASLTFERALSSRTSLSLGVGVLPNRRTSLLGLFLPKTADVEEEIFKAGMLGISGISVTPEFRWFPLKNTTYEAPFGFYLGAFLRYFNFTFDANILLQGITGTDSELEAVLNVWGVGGGIMVGNQIRFGKRVTLDVGLGIGRAPGRSKGTFSAQFLNQEEFQQVIDHLNDTFEDSFIGKLLDTFEFESIGEDLQQEGSGYLKTSPFYVFRANLGFGIAF